jgi:hypothetical protein
MSNREQRNKRELEELGKEFQDLKSKDARYFKELIF